MELWSLALGGLYLAHVLRIPGHQNDPGNTGDWRPHDLRSILMGEALGVTTSPSLHPEYLEKARTA